MQVVFRVDASNEIGFGHVIRCLTLATELRRKDVASTFICRDLPGNLVERVKQEGFKLFLLPASNEKNAKEHNYKDVSLGGHWQTDAEQVLNYINDIHPNWLVVDHYALDYQWEEYLSGAYKNLMVIDDLADRRHNCDLLLDQNFFGNMQDRYDGKVQPSCKKLIGPGYAMIQSIYSELRSEVNCRNMPLNRLFVFFGGIDVFDLTGLTLAALENLSWPFNHVDIVLSKKSPNFEKVDALTEGIINITLHSDLPSLAPLMMHADLAIGAGGTTNWERFCLGLPSLVITMADNQKKMNEDLNRAGLVKLIGDAESIHVDIISNALIGIMNSNDLEKWSYRCMEVCSGDGVSRVVNTMLEISND